MSLLKSIPPHGERTRLQLRGEVFNALNLTQFGGPVSDMTYLNCGKITGAASGRVIQVAAKFLF